MDINSFLQSVPPWAIAVAAGFLIGAVVLIISVILVKKHTRHLIDDIESARESGVFPLNGYSPKFLIKRTGIVESFAREKGKDIISLTEIDKLWLEKYRDKPDKKLMRSILEFIPDKGMFTVFLGVLEKPALAEYFLKAIGSEPGTLRRLPLSGSGEAFDSLKAKQFLAGRIDEVREMAGDPEWPVRYFAIKILLTEDDDRSQRAVEEALRDSHPLIRKTVIDSIDFLEKKAFYTYLNTQLTDDPSEEVRVAVYNRIMKDYSDDFTIDYDALDEVQILHALKFLNPDRDSDIDIAYKFLQSDNLEYRFPAAQFLQKYEYLQKILKEVDFKDTEVMKRNIDLLTRACEVKIDGFLSTNITGPASAFAALSILSEAGARVLIAPLARQVFHLPELKADKRVFEAAVKCISLRGDETAVSVLMEEFNANLYDTEKAEFILDRLPEKMEHKTYSYLYKALLDDGFAAREALIRAMVKLPPDTALSDLFGILYGGREKYSHGIRITALKIIAGYNLPYCLQPLIEQLPTLPVEEARAFSSLLSSYSGKLFNSRILKVLEKNDAKVRAAVIASLPSTGVKEFLKPVREALADADPDVRISSVWALAAYGEKKVLNQAVNMLRDPVERVRIAAAGAISKYATDEKLEVYLDIALDPNEVLEVRKAVVTGLSKSELASSVDFLIKIIDEEDDLHEAAVLALAGKTSKRDLKKIIENIKDASPALRQKIMVVLKKMGEPGEETIARLLEEDITSLKDQISRILEESGYVEHQVRLLSHRDPAVRKRAAEFLSRLGSVAAFRGIVLAARDPEEDIRVQVTRALEKLNSESGKEILEKLKTDPDKRVRKFTLWALERIQSKAIED